MRTLATVARENAALLRDWLRDGPLQLTSGPETGAVAGTVEPSGKIHYVYGEITGYYLHWLASGAVDLAAASRCAASALAWVMHRYGGDHLPPTRIHLTDDSSDWRNRVDFCFDLAMLAGGLAKAEERGLIDVPDSLWARCGAALARFSDGRHLTALAVGTDRTRVPQRWSTIDGPFLAKAASRILLVPARAQLSSRVVASARLTLAETCGMLSPRIDMLHPALYAIEGMICRNATAYETAAHWLAGVLAFDRGDGQLPEAVDSIVPRSDVIAQALRLAVWLRAREVRDAPSDGAIESLVTAITARVRPDGSIAFRPDTDSLQLNSWCAMFAQQALDWYSRWRDGDSLVGVHATDLV